MQASKHQHHSDNTNYTFQAQGAHWCIANWPPVQLHSHIWCRKLSGYSRWILAQAATHAPAHATAKTRKAWQITGAIRVYHV